MNCFPIKLESTLLFAQHSACSFSAIINDDVDDGGIDNGPTTPAKIVRDIRNVMNDTTVVNVPIQAYIIPSVDAHKVIAIHIPHSN